MPGETFLLPFRPGLDANAIPIVGARLEFYASQLDAPDSPGTSTPQGVYANEALTVKLGSVVQANSAGVWPTIYLDKAKTYRVVMRSPDGNVLDEADPYVLGATDTLAPDVAANAALASMSAGEAANILAAMFIQSMGYIGVEDSRPPVGTPEGEGYFYTLNKRLFGSLNAGGVASAPITEIMTAAALSTVDGSRIGYSSAATYPVGTVGYALSQSVNPNKLVANAAELRPGTGTTYPYLNSTYDRISFGEPLAPLATVAAGDGFANPFLREFYLAEGHEGGAETGMFNLQVRGAPKPGAANQNQNYNALQALATVTAPLGGTAPNLGDGRGQVFSLGSLAVLYPGAENIRNLTAGEFNTQASAGSSVAYKAGIQIVAMPDDKVRGSVYDCALSISSQVGAIGHDYGVLFSLANGQVAVHNQGTLIGQKDGGTYAFGVDFRGLTFTGNAFASQDFAVTGSGDIFYNHALTGGQDDVAAPVSLRGRTSGATTGAYDAQITFFGGNGEAGNGGINLEASLVKPAADNKTNLGEKSGGFASVYTWLLHVPQRPAESVPNAPEGTQTLFIDIVDGQLKRKAPSGVVTVIG